MLTPQAVEEKLKSKLEWPNSACAKDRILY